MTKPNDPPPEPADSPVMKDVPSVMEMTVQQIKQTELTPGEREILEGDKERYQRLCAGAQLDEWLEFYPGLQIRRRLAMRLAHTNKPEGKNYSIELNKLYADDGFDTSDKSYMKSLACILWLGEDPERMAILGGIRRAMTPGQRSRLNSPISAQQRVKEFISGTKTKRSPVALLKLKIAELERDNAALREKLARADSGSLFDLKNDLAPDIIDAILANTTAYKCEEIGKGLVAGAKLKRQYPVAKLPAG